MIKKISILLTFILIATTLQLGAQNTLTGKITDGDQNALTDAMVYVDTIKVETKINKRGFFEIKVPTTAQVINVYSPVYGLLSNPYQGEETMNFVFLKDSGTDAKVDVVNIEYSDLVDKSGNSGNANINLEEDKNVVGYNTIYDYIRGKVAGVTVSSTNRITIRGVNSVGGSSDPLFVVDGFPVQSLDYIDVNQVKNVEVSKDGSMYGVRGSNGVLIITLKKN
ncbi:TonB-dependent Receptor Plug Domain [Flavobacteriaceae bacterium MAR_2010_188]|nr:TonB-dependent Receptor Plug Domain [Flavobacteriaceae bacterium MAR_2010_188]